MTMGASPASKRQTVGMLKLIFAGCPSYSDTTLELPALHVNWGHGNKLLIPTFSTSGLQ